MIAEIDVDAGVARRCQRGKGLTAENIQRHPGTGEMIEGLPMPLWDGTLKLTRRAARIFPGCPIIGWDIAPTTDGPVVIEANSRPHHILHQTVTKRGLMTPEFEAFLDETRQRLGAAKKSGVSRWGALQRRAKWTYVRSLIWGGAD